MAAHDPVGGQVYECVARKVPVTGKCGASGVQDVQSVAVFKEAAVGMSEQGYLCAHFFCLIEDLIGGIPYAPVMTVGEEYPHSLCLKKVKIGALGGIVAVALDAEDLLFGVGFAHSVEIMLTVTQKNKHGGIFVASEYFSYCVGIAVSIGKNYDPQDCPSFRLFSKVQIWIYHVLTFIVVTNEIITGGSHNNAVNIQ